MFVVELLGNELRSRRVRKAEGEEYIVYRVYNSAHASVRGFYIT